MAKIQKFYLHDAASPYDPNNVIGVQGWGIDHVFGIAGSGTGNATGAAVSRSATGVIGTQNPDLESTFTAVANTSQQNWGHRRFLTPPLAAHTFTAAEGNWTFSYARFESSAQHNQSIRCLVYGWQILSGSATQYGGKTTSDSAQMTGTEGTTSETAESVTGAWGATSISIPDGAVLIFDVYSIFTQGNASALSENFAYDGTTEASATTCASFVQAPVPLDLFNPPPPATPHSRIFIPAQTLAVPELAVQQTTPGPATFDPTRDSNYDQIVLGDLPAYGAYWKLNEKSGTTFADRGPNRLDLKANVSLDASLGLSTTSPSTVTTTVAASAGSKVIIGIEYFHASATLSSVSGGGLAWSIDKQFLAGSVGVAIVSADAPSGLASGTTITMTFSATPSGGCCCVFSFLGLATGGGSVDTTSNFNGGSLGSPAAWNSGSLATTGFDLLIAVEGYDKSTTTVNATTPPATGLFDIRETLIGESMSASYLIEPLSGSYAVSGTVTGAVGAGQLNAIGVAYKAANPSIVANQYPGPDSGDPILNTSPLFSANATGTIKTYDFAFPDRNPYSLEIWVNIFDFFQPNPAVWMEKLGANGGYVLRLNSVSGQNVAEFQRVGASTDVADATSATLSTDVWQHIVATYDGTTMSLYVNGVLGGTQASSILQPSTDSSFFTIGNQIVGYAAKGAVYSTALSAAQVLKHFQAGVPSTWSPQTDPRPPSNLPPFGFLQGSRIVPLRFFDLTIPTFPVSQTLGAPYEATQAIQATEADPYEATKMIVVLGSGEPYEATQAIQKVGSSDPLEANQGLAATLGDPYEANKGLAATASDPYEATQGIQATKSEPWEANQGVQKIGSTDSYEALQGITKSNADPYEANQGLAATRSNPWEANKALSITVIEPYEAGQGIRATFSDPYEANKGLATTASDPYEALQAISRTGSEPWEALVGVAQTISDPYEALKGIAGTGSLPYEALKAIAAVASLPYEALARIAAVASEPYEALTGITRSNSEPYEALQGIAASGVLPYEALQALAVARSLPYEALVRLAAVASLPWEANVGIAATVTDPYEALQGVSSARSLPWEAQGQVVVTQTASLPYEALQGIASNPSLPYEGLKSISQTTADPYEALTGIRSTSGDPYEVLQGISATRSLPYEALQQIRATGSLPYEALKAISASSGLPYEALVRLAAVASLPYEALVRIAATVLLPWEAGGVVRTTVSNTATLPLDVLAGLAATGRLPWEAGGRSGGGRGGSGMSDAEYRRLLKRLGALHDEMTEEEVASAVQVLRMLGFL